MPRITAPTLAEHVGLQRGRILDAAGKLFLEKGYADTTLKTVAEEIGLRRNSLYRYFPDLNALFLAWIEREYKHLQASGRAILAHPGPAARRIMAWFAHQTGRAAVEIEGQVRMLQLASPQTESLAALVAVEQSMSADALLAVVRRLPHVDDAAPYARGIIKLTRAAGDATDPHRDVAAARAEVERMLDSASRGAGPTVGKKSRGSQRRISRTSLPARI